VVVTIARSSSPPGEPGPRGRWPHCPSSPRPSTCGRNSTTSPFSG